MIYANNRVLLPETEDNHPNYKNIEVGDKLVTLDGLAKVTEAAVFVIVAEAKDGKRRVMPYDYATIIKKGRKKVKLVGRLVKNTPAGIE